MQSIKRFTAPVLAAFLSLAVAPNTNAQTSPVFPLAPDLSADKADWRQWFINLYIFTLNSGKLTNPALVRDAFTIHGDWSVKKTNNGSGQYSFTHGKAIELWNYVWGRPGTGKHDTDILLEAQAYNRWSTRSSHAQYLAGDVEWEFSYFGGPHHTGRVRDLEAWYQYVGYARAYNDTCGVYAVNAGSYSDGVGAALPWNLSVSAETTTTVLPVSISLNPPNGGIGASVNLSVSSGSFEYKYNRVHRPKASKMVQGTPQAPGRITIIKKAETQTFGKLSSLLGFCGPGSAEMYFQCWFYGRFDDVANGEGPK